MEKPTIIEALASPHFFGPAFPSPDSWRHWETFLKTLYGLPLDTAEQETYRECTQRVYQSVPYHEAYAIVGRRGGKSRIASLVACYEAIFGNWADHLAPGEKAYVFVIATDKSQSKICLDYVRGLLELFPGIVKRQGSEDVELNNRMVIASKTCTFRGSRGYSTAVVICDEIAFWRDENSANPAQEVIVSLLPGLLPGGLLLGISTPYAKFGYLYEVFDKFFGKESDVLVWKAGTRFMNPCYDQSIMNRLIARDRTAFTAEFDATFREDVENFLPESLVRSAVKHPNFLPYDSAKRYMAFIDPSGGRSDSMTLAIGHREKERIIVDLVLERKPPFDPTAVVKEFADVMKSYCVKKAFSDRYGGVWVEDSFKKAGMYLRMSDLDKNSIYLNFQPLISMNRVELPDDETTILQLRLLERKTRSGGQDAIDHPRGLHDDAANAVAGVATHLSREHVWSAEDMDRFLPRTLSKHEAMPNSNEALMDMFRKQSGLSRIVRKTVT
jgi:hypothetical protein